jgi:hypothetical protein
MTDEPVYAHGSTAPPLAIDLVRGRGRLPVELPAEAVVTARVTRAAVEAAAITRPATILTYGAAGTPARVRVDWLVGDLVNLTADTVRYEIDLTITTDAGDEHLPAPLSVRVRPAIG